MSGNLVAPFKHNYKTSDTLTYSYFRTKIGKMTWVGLGDVLGLGFLKDPQGAPLELSAVEKVQSI